MRIIIIDDDYYTGETLSRLLAAKGFSTQIHTTMGDAIRTLLAEEFDAMILDYHLPGLNGTDALPIIQEVAPRLPVILMMDESTLEDREKALRAGAFTLLQKPINQRAVLRALRAVRPSPRPKRRRK
jgi:DNA-binding response OmpR family regulator